MSRIVLINPPKEVPLLDWTMRYPPLGLMSVAAGLDGHEVEILDLKMEKLRPGALRSRLSGADIVGVTILTPSIDSGLEVCRTAKECGALTVAGGVHPSLMPQIVQNPEVDIVVRGEGELTFREIADGRPPASIAGISYVDGSGVAHNPDRPQVDLNTLPPPRRDLVSAYSGRYTAFGQGLDALSTARGCPFRCTFCCVPMLWRGYRELSPREVVNELKRMKATEIVSIVDDNFCHDMRRVEAICDLIISEGLDDRLYSVFSRIDSIVRYPDVVAKMARANMRVVFIGIEAATQDALDRMNKKTRIEDITRACDILERNGMFIWAGHIIGNLEDTYDDVLALMRMSNRLPLDMADFTVITPYPGTELYRQAVADGLVDEFDFAEYCECEPHMHTTHLSRMEIMELQIKAYLKFYGLGRMIKRANRWSGNPGKRWILERRLTGIRSFMRFRDRSAFYFWRTYRETVGKTEGTRIRRFSPLFSTPWLYSLGAGIVAALVTVLLTIALGSYYADYSSRPLAFIVADLLFAGALVAFTTAALATWFAVRSYRHGWIFSLRRRKPAGNRRSLSELSLRNGGLYAAAALVAVAVLIAVVLLVGPSGGPDYTLKEVMVTVIAFLAAMAASYTSIASVRRGEIA
ncbi:MAG: B12-binding domain-containing radical SAM protein [Actinobacteria bacterium]|nr:B12-binding domain-containing radical SAM protein [Actinomycetota bacterium]MBU2687159.1 B12-binding domain-containing radical SAM protein [Actinomycetota bacterium]